MAVRGLVGNRLSLGEPREGRGFFFLPQETRTVDRLERFGT
jgi:hypothetical protein